MSEIEDLINSASKEFPPLDDNRVEMVKEITSILERIDDVEAMAVVYSTKEKGESNFLIMGHPMMCYGMTATLDSWMAEQVYPQ